jgi:hypothetical protein
MVRPQIDNDVRPQPRRTAYNGSGDLTNIRLRSKRPT